MGRHWVEMEERKYLDKMGILVVEVEVGNFYSNLVVGVVMMKAKEHLVNEA